MTRILPRRARLPALFGIWLVSVPLAGAAAGESGPDAELWREAQQARDALSSSPSRQARRLEWEKVIMRYRRVVARFPQSGYCDDALLAVGDLYRAMARRLRTPRFKQDAVLAYRTLVAEYPSSRKGEDALFAVFEIARESGDRARLSEAGRSYLEAFPRGRRADTVRSQLRRRIAATPAALPTPPPPGLADVFNVRFWSGDSSTRVVLDVEKQVKLRYERIQDPDRLWIDLVGTRLHPNLTDRAFPVGDGLLRQIRVAQNRADVVRVVLDFKEAREHAVFYLDNPTRLVVDVRGEPAPQVAAAVPSAPPPATTAEGLPVATAEEAEPFRPSPAPAPASLATPIPLPPQVNRAGSYSLARQLGLGVRTIVIDPGHGGHDPGTTGPGGLQEKELVLDVALRLVKLLRRELNAQVIMTRSTDVFIPLEERTAIANSKGADLFLSIHANSSRSARSRGVETYFLNFAADSHAEAVAARENAISPATLKDLQNLVRAIALNSKVDESRDFAVSVQEAMMVNLRSHDPDLPDRGVRTAPFYVLIGAEMPAVLAEIAFLSHSQDESRLRRPEHRDRVAKSLFQGVRAYWEGLGRRPPQQLTGSGAGSTLVSGGPR